MIDNHFPLLQINKPINNLDLPITSNIVYKCGIILNLMNDRVKNWVRDLHFFLIHQRLQPPLQMVWETSSTSTAKRRLSMGIFPSQVYDDPPCAMLMASPTSSSSDRRHPRRNKIQMSGGGSVNYSHIICNYMWEPIFHMALFLLSHRRISQHHFNRRRAIRSKMALQKTYAGGNPHFLPSYPARRKMILNIKSTQRFVAVLFHDRGDKK